MVAIIKTGQSIRRILNYNESKVKEGVAVCIHAENYPMEVAELPFTYKLNRLVRQADLNKNVRRNSVHITLNFHPSEVLKSETMTEIATAYMQKIGFAAQPYLVYRHFDVAHPHIHIVTTKVRGDGSRIDMNNIGRNQSEQARKEIEADFNLRPAKACAPVLTPDFPKAIVYGKVESKKALSIVLESVLSKYVYSSVPELNIILRDYNVLADRGEKSSRLYARKGLLFKILDRNGKPIGVPVKASDFHFKPTLTYLQLKFQANRERKIPFKAGLKKTIDEAILKCEGDMSSLERVLLKSEIRTCLRENTAGLAYGISFFDTKNKCVFNGSSLGKRYSVAAIQRRVATVAVAVRKSDTIQSYGNRFDSNPKSALLESSSSPKDLGTWLQLTSADVTPDVLPFELKRKKKKKRKSIKR